MPLRTTMLCVRVCVRIIIGLRQPNEVDAAQSGLDKGNMFRELFVEKKTIK